MKQDTKENIKFWFWLSVSATIAGTCLYMGWHFGRWLVGQF